MQASSHAVYDCLLLHAPVQDAHTAQQVPFLKDQQDRPLTHVSQNVFAQRLVVAAILYPVLPHAHTKQNRVLAFAVGDPLQSVKYRQRTL